MLLTTTEGSNWALIKVGLKTGSDAGQAYEASTSTMTPSGPQTESTAYLESRAMSEVSRSNLDCLICIDGFVMGEIITTLLCSHIFYADCLTPWLMYNGVCPICQSEV